MIQVGSCNTDTRISYGTVLILVTHGTNEIRLLDSSVCWYPFAGALPALILSEEVKTLQHP